MAVLVNGRAESAIDSADRGLHYGDGLFETLAVTDGRARFFGWHCERLAEGAARLGMPMPDRDRIREEIAAAWPQGRGVVKYLLTRGAGERGYRPPASPRTTRIAIGAGWPARNAALWIAGVRLRRCRTRLGRNPALAGIKHLNRLEQVLARAEWDDADVAEGFMLDDRERVISGTQSNLFARISGQWVTPALGDCGIAGVMRRAFRSWAMASQVAVVERDLPAAEFACATAVILTNALVGAWPVRECEGRALAPDPDAARFNAWLETQ